MRNAEDVNLTARSDAARAPRKIVARDSERGQSEYRKFSDADSKKREGGESLQAKKPQTFSLCPFLESLPAIIFGTCLNSRG